MKLTKIHVNDKFSKNSIISKVTANICNDILIVVPDEESYHLIKGLSIIHNKVWEVHLLEPGTPFSWQGMYSPWHLNTDRYQLSFINHVLQYVSKV